MIDETKAIQMAKDAGLLEDNWHNGYFCGWAKDMQARITRAQNEAFEYAALICERSHEKCKPEYLAECVRALKQE